MKTPIYKPLSTGSKRARSADAGTMQNRTYQDAGTQVIPDTHQGYTQLSRTGLYYGKKLSKDDKKMKLIGARMQKVIERFQNVNITAKGTGKFPLDFFIEGNGYAFMPCYTFDLTCVPNHARPGDYTIAGGTIKDDLVYPCPMRRLRKGAAQQNWYTEVVSGRDQDDNADVKHWLPERYPSSIRELMAHDAAMIEKCDIRLMLYGAKKRPSRVTVELWQFTDDLMVPMSQYVFYDGAGGSQIASYNLDPPAVGFGPQGTNWNNMWMSLMDRQIGNPIAKRGMKTSQTGINVLYRREFEFQPIDTGEGDQTGHQEEVHFRYDMNKVCGFADYPDDTQVTTDELDNANEWDVQGNKKVACFTVPKGRVFLVVRGMTLEQTQPESGVLAEDVAPSFDLIVRRTRSQLV